MYRSRFSYPIFRFTLLALFGGMLLGGCALFEGEARPRPGVREAKACMAVMRQNPAFFPGYQIESCTHNGIWVVEQIDPQGLLVSKYDFLNREYAGPETGGGFVGVDTLGFDKIGTFDRLHVQLNQELLAADKS